MLKGKIISKQKKAWDFHPKPRHMNHNHFKPIGLAFASLRAYAPQHLHHKYMSMKLGIK